MTRKRDLLAWALLAALALGIAANIGSQSRPLDHGVSYLAR